MEPKDGYELTEVKVVCDDSNTKEVRIPTVRMPIGEKRRSASLKEMDGSPHNSPRNISPRSSLLLQKRRSVSEADLSTLDPEELARRAAQITVGIGHPQYKQVEELCSQEFAKMSPKKPTTSSQQPPQKKKKPVFHKKRRQYAHEDTEQPQVTLFDHEYGRSFQKLATAQKDELGQRSSTAIDISGWMITKAFESRSQAIEAERYAVREKEKTARMKNFFGFLAAMGGGGVTILTAVLAYSAASSNHCDPCEICDVCQNIVNGTINS